MLILSEIQYSIIISNYQNIPKLMSNQPKSYNCSLFSVHYHISSQAAEDPKPKKQQLDSNDIDTKSKQYKFLYHEGMDQEQDNNTYGNYEQNIYCRDVPSSNQLSIAQQQYYDAYQRRLREQSDKHFQHMKKKLSLKQFHSRQNSQLSQNTSSTQELNQNYFQLKETIKMQSKSNMSSIYHCSEDYRETKKCSQVINRKIMGLPSNWKKHKHQLSTPHNPSIQVNEQSCIKYSQKIAYQCYKSKVKQQSQIGNSISSSADIKIKKPSHFIKENKKNVVSIDVQNQFNHEQQQPKVFKGKKAASIHSNKVSLKFLKNNKSMSSSISSNNCQVIKQQQQSLNSSNKSFDILPRDSKNMYQSKSPCSFDIQDKNAPINIDSGQLQELSQEIEKRLRVKRKTRKQISHSINFTNNGTQNDCGNQKIDSKDHILEDSDIFPRPRGLSIQTKGKTLNQLAYKHVSSSGDCSSSNQVSILQSDVILQKLEEFKSRTNIQSQFLILKQISKKGPFTNKTWNLPNLPR